jgi:hypothetical protein
MFEPAPGVYDQRCNDPLCHRAAEVLVEMHAPRWRQWLCALHEDRLAFGSVEVLDRLPRRPYPGDGYGRVGQRSPLAVK